MPASIDYTNVSTLLDLFERAWPGARRIRGTAAYVQAFNAFTEGEGYDTITGEANEFLRLETTREFFFSETAERGTEEYFEQAIIAGYYGVDDKEVYAFKPIS